MREVILYVCQSLVGYLRHEAQKMDWMYGDDPTLPDLNYDTFIENVDTVLMGKRTYDIICQLSDEWPYAKQHAYVFTHQTNLKQEGITFLAQPIKDVIDTLKKQEGKHIWICGGASLIQQCVEKDLIDTYELFMIPVILGKGIPLFSSCPLKRLKLRTCQAKNGIVRLSYRRHSYDAA